MHSQGGTAMCDEIAMLKGEKRKIRLYVHSRKNDVFVIRNAYIEILQYSELIKTIECTIDEHILHLCLHLMKQEATACQQYMKLLMK